MEGVRILAQSPVYDTVYSWGWSWSGFIIAILAVAILVTMIIAVLSGTGEALILLGFIVILGAASFCCFEKGNSEEVYSHEEYKVIIDDSVSLNDFYEKYEVISREGEIYTVIEREQG